MPAFTPTGDLLADLQSAIDTQTVVFIRYMDRKGEPSERNIAPLELRGDSLFAWSLEKNALRMFKLNGIQNYQILEDTFDKNQFQS